MSGVGRKNLAWLGLEVVFFGVFLHSIFVLFVERVRGDGTVVCLDALSVFW